MSPTCSNRLLAGRKARSAAVRITRASAARMSAQLWASGGDLHAPPAHQHADAAEARGRVVVLAAGLADVPVREPLPFVRAGVGGDCLEAGGGVLLPASARAQCVADLFDAIGEVVAQRFEVAHVEHPRPAGRPNAPVELIA